MPKCDKCNKNITKSNAGVECSKCEKLVHLSVACSGLSTKQRAALRINNNLGWTCDECHRESPHRRSVVVPEDEEEEETAEALSPKATIDIKKLLRDISLEMEKAIKRELQDLTKSFEFHTEKMDEILETMDAFKISVQELTKKNNDLTNKNNHLKTRVGALEQRLQEIEQQQLSTTLTISNVPHEGREKPLVLVEKIAERLELNREDILEVRRLPSRQPQNGPIQVKLSDEVAQEKWLQKAKSTKIIVSSLFRNTSPETAQQSIIIREALTAYNKKLLWNTKQQLKDIYKYIWCKKGVIRVRKEDNTQLKIIRSEDDIKNLLLQ
ncbi:uncharacterized protein LOC113233744 [Hyposmocoma kahamanoa]|uniref:uncharacterized protein LOC113233744 n=1 Tax=Hyposmocoma kahamanoa TaxID=1477025 RepID=UPI000E6D9A53|nr:uncharacterized protein LOC113233744 [Hyposmocoma kahamanoa]